MSATYWLPRRLPVTQLFPLPLLCSWLLRSWRPRRTFPATLYNHTKRIAISRRVPVQRLEPHKDDRSILLVRKLGVFREIVPLAEISANVGYGGGNAS